jgi:hypothetical protein
MPILPFVTAFLLFRLFRSRHPLLESFVRAAVVWGMLLLLLTEVLSSLHTLTFVGVSSSWALIILALGPPVWRGRRVPHPPGAPMELQRWVIPPLAAILGITLLIALVAPPNTTDAMTYPLLPMARSRGLDLRVQFAFVENETREFEGKDPAPCALLAVYRPPDWRLPARYGTWRLVWRESRVGFWLPPNTSRKSSQMPDLPRREGK